MIVAGLQLDLAWEEPEENFRRATVLAERAAAAGGRLLVLPEMFSTGFSLGVTLRNPCASVSTSRPLVTTNGFSGSRPHVSMARRSAA